MVGLGLGVGLERRCVRAVRLHVAMQLRRLHLQPYASEAATACVPSAAPMHRATTTPSPSPDPSPDPRPKRDPNPNPCGGCTCSYTCTGRRPCVNLALSVTLALSETLALSGTLTPAPNRPYLLARVYVPAVGRAPVRRAREDTERVGLGAPLVRAPSAQDDLLAQELG